MAGSTCSLGCLIGNCLVSIRGFEITLAIDKNAYQGGSALVLASVLERFFALYVSANSFIQLILKEVNSAPKDIWKQWPPRPGKQLQL